MVQGSGFNPQHYSYLFTNTNKINELNKNKVKEELSMVLNTSDSSILVWGWGWGKDRRIVKPRLAWSTQEDPISKTEKKNVEKK